MKNIILFGGGTHVSYCIDIIEKENQYNIVGIIDSIAENGSEMFGYRVIGKQENLLDLQNKYNFNSGLITVGDNYGRKYVRDFIISLSPSFNFISAIHPSVILSKSVKLGRGIVMMANVVVNPACIIEDFCILNTGSQLEHNSFMGEFSHLSAGSTTGGKVSIGKMSAITLGVTIVDRITIGENTVVGSGSVVLKDLPDNVLAYGNPAKVIRKREPGEKFLKSG